jgi:hypothetical protein
MGQRQARAAEEPPMGADVSDAETASDEMIAQVAAGGTYSFAPEPDEDEAVLPGEEVAEAESALAADDAPPAAAEAPAAEVAVEVPVEAPAESTEQTNEDAAEPAAAAADEQPAEVSAEAQA